MNPYWLTVDMYVWPPYRVLCWAYRWTLHRYDPTNAYGWLCWMRDDPTIIWC